MSIRSLVVLVIVAVSIAAAAAYALGVGRGGSSATTTTTTTKAATTTTQVVEGAIYLVYRDRPPSAKAVEGVMKLFEESVYKGTMPFTIDVMHVSKWRWGNVSVLVYPLIVLKVPRLTEDLSNVVKPLGGDTYLLKQVLIPEIARRVGLSVEYTHTAEAYIVNGTTPYTSIPKLKREVVKLMEDLLSATILANITRVEFLSPSEVSGVGTYPTILFKSGFDLSKEVPYLERAGEYLVFKDVYASNIVTALSSFAGRELKLETRVRPSPSGPHIGSSNASVEVYTYTDLDCPYCARFFTKVLPSLIEDYVGRGEVAVYFKPLVVHEESMEGLALLTCYYLSTNDSMGYYEALKELYEKALKEGKPPTAEDVREVLSSVGRPVKGLDECVDVAATALKDESVEAVRRGIGGTPGFIIWSKGRGLGIVAVGLMSYDEFKGLIEWALGPRGGAA